MDCNNEACLFDGGDCEGVGSIENCTNDCPRNWIKDNYCDEVCNNEGCFYDGGDC